MSLISVPNFSAYLGTSTVTDPWGACVAGTGHAEVAPGDPYPAGEHPPHHALSWKDGRILQHFHIVYITHGQGIFESTISGQQKVSCGSVMLLFPGVWHRYRPQQEVGWVEDWIELDGYTVDRVLKQKSITPAEPVLNIGLRPEILDLFYECHGLARSNRIAYEPVLAVLGLQILSRVLYFHLDDKEDEPAMADIGIQRAQSLIAASIDQPVRMEEIADEVGMGYSHFRRAFRARTGLSPKQYHLQLRLRQARAMLLNSSMSVAEIADTLGFDSPFHLSAAFKAKMGVSPTQWKLNALTQRPTPTIGTDS